MRRGTRFRHLVAEVEAIKPQMPASGMSAAAFEALALGRVAPDDVRFALDYLHNRGVIFLRRNRGDVRVFAERPTSIVGVFSERDEIDKLLSSATIHVRRIAFDLAAREDAKKNGNTVGANEARDRMAATAARLVVMVRKRVEAGIPMDAIRSALLSTYAADVTKFIAGFEPALALGATCELPCLASSAKRLTAGLDDRGKVTALLTKAGEQGLTKSDLLRSMRPKPPADRLGAILTAGARAGELQARQVRVRGARFATRYFAA